MWGFVLALMAVAPALGPLEALATDALLAAALCGERLRQLHRTAAGGGRDDEDGKWRRNPDGSVSVQIRSMETLASALRSAPGV